MTKGIRVGLFGKGTAPDGTPYGPKGTAVMHEDGNGYIIAWDDDWVDHESTRWSFDDTVEPQYNLVELKEGE